jgi:hypothetical protein
MADMKPRYAAALALVRWSSIPLLLLSGGCRFFRHKVTCSPVWTAPTTFGRPITVSGTIHPAFTSNCTGGTFAHARFFIGCPDSINPTCVGHPWPSASNPVGPAEHPDYFGPIDEGTATRFSFDTTTVPNAQYDLGLNLVDAHGGVIGAIHPAGEVDHDQVVTVANSVRTPTSSGRGASDDPRLKEK